MAEETIEDEVPTKVDRFGKIIFLSVQPDWQLTERADEPQKSRSLFNPSRLVKLADVRSL